LDPNWKELSLNSESDSSVVAYFVTLRYTFLLSPDRNQLQPSADSAVRRSRGSQEEVGSRGMTRLSPGSRSARDSSQRDGTAGAAATHYLMTFANP